MAISGGNSIDSKGLFTANAASTMFAQRHTQSILSNETNEQHVLANLAEQNAEPVQAVITEEVFHSEEHKTNQHVTNPAYGEDFETGTRETIQVD